MQGEDRNENIEKVAEGNVKHISLQGEYQNDDIEKVGEDNIDKDELADQELTEQKLASLFEKHAENMAARIEQNMENLIAALVEKI